MYHTNEAYKATVATYPQKFDLSIEITFDESTGLDTVTVPPDDIFEAGFSEEIFLSTFYVGAAVEPRFWVRVHNQNGKYSENALATAEIRPRMTLYNEAGEALDAVPVGVFHVTKITAQNSDLRLECMDRMPYLNRLFEPQDVTSNLYAICRRIASTVGAEFKTTPFSLVTGETGNASTGQWITKKSILNAMVDDSIFKGYSYTQVLRFIAEVCGSFAIFDNEGNLELRWFKESDVTLTGDFARSALELNGNTFSMDGNVVQVTGVNVVSEDTELARVGTDKYLLTLNENPIATAMPQTAAEAVLFRMKNTKYIPCRYERIGGDPSVQLGDILTIIDNKERYDEAKADTYDRYSLFLTSRNWRYNGALSENYNASGNPDKDLNTDRGMTVSKRMAQLAKRVTEVEKNITDGMTDYEAALLMFNDKMFNANGLYKTVRTKENGSIILYFHDETELENSMVIHMFSAAGFAWTTDGWNNSEPLWRYGFTDAGDAILNTINAYILSADIIKTGLLQSQNGASWINMDNGTFCFRSAIPEGMDLDTGKPIYSYENKLLLNEKNELLINGKIVNNRGADIIWYLETTSSTTGITHKRLEIGDILDVDSVYMNASSDIWFFADEVRANATTLATTSDKRLKSDITDISFDSRFLDFFDNLIPSAFKYTEGKSGRTHMGLIAQQVEQAAIKAGLDINNIAAYVKSKAHRDDLDGYELALRYDEFIGLIIAKVQNLSARLEKQEQEIAQLKAELSALRQ